MTIAILCLLFSALGALFAALEWHGARRRPTPAPVRIDSVEIGIEITITCECECSEAIADADRRAEEPVSDPQAGVAR